MSTPLKPLHEQYPQAKVFTEPDRAFAPILILGAVGGTIIGLIVGKWGV